MQLLVPSTAGRLPSIDEMQRKECAHTGVRLVWWAAVQSVRYQWNLTGKLCDTMKSKLYLTIQVVKNSFRGTLHHPSSEQIVDVPPYRYGWLAEEFKLISVNFFLSRLTVVLLFSFIHCLSSSNWFDRQLAPKTQRISADKPNTA